MIHIDIVILYARTQVEGTDAHIPLFLKTLVLCAGIFVTERPVDGCRNAREAIACARVVTAGNGECGDVSVIRKPLHPVFGLYRHYERQTHYKSKDVFLHILLSFILVMGQIYIHNIPCYCKDNK